MTPTPRDVEKARELLKSVSFALPIEFHNEAVNAIAASLADERERCCAALVEAANKYIDAHHIESGYDYVFYCVDRRDDDEFRAVLDALKE